MGDYTTGSSAWSPAMLGAHCGDILYGRMRDALEQYQRQAHVEMPTPREWEILVHLSQGFGTKSIAAALGIGYETVKWHQKTLYWKLDVHSAVQAIRIGRAAGMLAHIQV